MKKRILSLFLALSLIVSLVPALSAPAAAAGAPIVFVSVSVGRHLASDKDGSLVAQVPVTVTDYNGSGTYDIDDALYALHEDRFSGAASAGYASSSTAYGLSLNKLWGETTGVGGYQVNSGNTSVSSLAAEVSDGDYIDAYVYSDTTNWSDVYTCFDQRTVTAVVGESLSLSLSGNTWGGISPVSGAAVYAAAADSAALYDAANSVGSTGAGGEIALSFDTAGTYIVSAASESAVLTAPICVVMVSPISVYVTASYQGEALASTGNGANAAPAEKMVFKRVELGSGSLTVAAALTQLAHDYCQADGSGAAFASGYVSDYWKLQSGGTTTGYVGSVVLLNGEEQAYGWTGGVVEDGDQITLSLYDYLADYSGTIAGACIGDADGDYLGITSVVTGSTLSFGAFSGGSAAGAACRLYVTDDPASLPTALAGGTYTFDTPGTYYILARDANAGSAGAAYGLAAARITVADSIENAAPVRRSGVPAAAAAGTYTGKAYTLALTSIFKDANGDALSYKVSINNGAAAAAPASYSFAPAQAGTYTLRFIASDDTEDSVDSYTVTLTVTDPPAVSAALTGLSQYYSDIANLTLSDGNFRWAIADLTAYNPTVLSDSVKQACVDYIVTNASSASSTGDLAGYIITLRALGYDAEKIVKDSSGTVFDAVAEMNGRIALTTSIYTTPYMLIALEQYGSTYSAQAGALVESILDAQLAGGGWNGFGTDMDADSTAPALLALAPYYPANADVKTAVDKALTLISGLQGASGAIISCWSGAPDPSSTGLMVAGLSALGKNPAAYTKNGRSLLDGLLLLYQNADDLFGSGSNSYADEQGFRGLAAYAGYAAAGDAYRIYDFSGKGMLAATASSYFSHCPVSIAVVPAGAAVELKDSGSLVKTPLVAGVYDLEAGTYTYTVSKTGYTEKTGSITVTADEASGHIRKTLSVSLASAPAVTKDISVKVYVKTHPDHDTGTYTYKNNASSYFNIVARTVTLKSGSTVFDALDAALTAEGILYTESASGYISIIDGISEFDHGINSGWLYRVGSTTPEIDCRSYTLTGNSTVTWFFTDDYTSEYGSESWGGSSGAEKTQSEEIKITVTVKDGAAQVAVDADDIALAISSANGAGSKLITIDADIIDDVDSVSVGVSADSLDRFANSQNVALAVKTPIGTVHFSNETLTSVAAQAAGDVAISIKEKTGGEAGDIIARAQGFATQQTDLSGCAVVEVGILSGDKKITDFGGGKLKITLPVDSTKYTVGQIYKVYVVSGDGTVEVLAGTVAVIDGRAAVKVETTHLSAFVVSPDKFAVFGDVAAGAWYYDAVSFAANKGLFTGTKAGAFEPGKNMSRAMLVTVLYRLDGQPEEKGVGGFSDVAAGQWYTDAVAWASAKGIVGGYGGGLFGPHDSITREQTAAILYRYAQYKGYDVSKTADLSGYADAGHVSAYAAPCMKWASAQGLISGVASGKLSPCATATRAQIAMILMRFCKNVIK